MAWRRSSAYLVTAVLGLGAVASVLPIGASAAPTALPGAGYLDPRFGSGGSVEVPSSSGRVLHDMKVDAQGRIVTVAAMRRHGVTGTGDVFVSVRTSSGGVASTFNAGAPLRIARHDAYCYESCRFSYQVLPLPDGRIRVVEDVEVGGFQTDWGNRTTITLASNGRQVAWARSYSALHASAVLPNQAVRGCSRALEEVRPSPKTPTSGLEEWRPTFRFVGLTMFGKPDPAIGAGSGSTASPLCTSQRWIVGADSSRRLYTIERVYTGNRLTAYQLRRWTSSGSPDGNYGPGVIAAPTQAWLAKWPIVRIGADGSAYIATTGQRSGTGTTPLIMHADAKGQIDPSWSGHRLVAIGPPSRYGTVRSAVPTSLDVSNGRVVVGVHASTASADGKQRGIAWLTRVDARRGLTDGAFGQGGWVRVPRDVSHLQTGAYRSVLSGAQTVSGGSAILLQRRIGTTS